MIWLQFDISGLPVSTFSTTETYALSELGRVPDVEFVLELRRLLRWFIDESERDRICILLQLCDIKYKNRSSVDGSLELLWVSSVEMEQLDGLLYKTDRPRPLICSRAHIKDFRVRSTGEAMIYWYRDATEEEINDVLPNSLPEIRDDNTVRYGQPIDQRSVQASGIRP